MASIAPGRTLLDKPAAAPHADAGGVVRQGTSAAMGDAASSCPHAWMEHKTPLVPSAPLPRREARSSVKGKEKREGRGERVGKRKRREGRRLEEAGFARRRPGSALGVFAALRDNHFVWHSSESFCGARAWNAARPHCFLTRSVRTTRGERSRPCHPSGWRGRDRTWCVHADAASCGILGGSR